MSNFSVDQNSSTELIYLVCISLNGCIIQFSKETLYLILLIRTMETTTAAYPLVFDPGS